MPEPIPRLRPDDGAPLDERERALHLCSRLAFGPAPGQVDQVVALGAETWLEDQLTPAPLPDGRLRETLDGLETMGMSMVDRYDLCVQPIRTGPGSSRSHIAGRGQVVDELSTYVLRRAIHGPRQAAEVLAEFWRNHLNVSFTKTFPAHAYLSSYELEVVREHALGSFPAMLRASARHPAMLHYLDNHLSRRPPSDAELNDIELKARQRTGSRSQGEDAAAIAAQRGLNENYARELLELHTLGVDNGYDQDDVVAAAQALTGWTFDGGRLGSQRFGFDKAMHWNEGRRFLGFSLRKDKDDGPGQGERILEILSEHKGTAHFLAAKLARYLVADEPAEDLVAKVAKAYLKHDGDVRAMVRAVVDHEAFWDRANYRTKFRTPFEFVVAAVRVTGAEVEHTRGLTRALEEMGQPLYHCDDPTGYYDAAEHWLDPGVLASRWKLALDLAANRVDGVRIPDAFFYELPSELGPLAWMRELVAQVLPAGASSRTLAMLYEVVRREPAPDYAALGKEVLGLLLGSPEFQKQ